MFKGFAMTYYADLSTECMVESGPHVRAVGWLNPTMSHTTGEVTQQFVDKLRSQCEHPYQPMRLQGFHECEFRTAESVQCNATGIRNVWIPSRNNLLYVAPAMIVHYIEAHGYRPPDEFIQAVIDAPEQKSDEYWRLMAPFGHTEPIIDGLTLRAYEALSEKERQIHHTKSKRTPEWAKENPIQAAIAFGEEHYEQGNFQEAAAHLQVVVSEGRADQERLLMFATACQKSSRFDEAIAVSSDLVARNTEYPGTVTRGLDALLIRARCYQGLNDIEKAKADYATAIERSEYCADAYAGLSECFHAEGNANEAARCMDLARKNGYAGQTWFRPSRSP